MLWKSTDINHEFIVAELTTLVIKQKYLFILFLVIYSLIRFRYKTDLFTSKETMLFEA